MIRSKLPYERKPPLAITIGDELRRAAMSSVAFKHNFLPMRGSMIFCIAVPVHEPYANSVLDLAQLNSSMLLLCTSLSKLTLLCYHLW